MRQCFVIVTFLLVLGWGDAGPATAARADETTEQLGPMAVGKCTVAVELQYPTEQDASALYRVTLLICKPRKAAVIKAEDLDVWVMHKGLGRSMRVRDRPPKGVLAEEGEGETVTVKATFTYRCEVVREALAAIVVSVQGEPILFKVPQPRK
jgi:hypothetical protein